MYSTEHEIKSFLEKIGVVHYGIREGGVVDVVGSVDISDLGLLEIPVQFGFINGNFMCYNNKLSSLEGCPSVVDGNFNCSSNRITSLEYLPKEVSMDIDCSDNKIVSLKGVELVLGGSFYCMGVELLTLECDFKSVKGFVHFDKCAIDIDYSNYMEKSYIKMSFQQLKNIGLNIELNNLSPILIDSVLPVKLNKI